MAVRRSGRFQLIGLCEGKTDKRFLEALARRWGIEAKVEAAPEGEGDASRWVVSRYAAYVRRQRAFSTHVRVGLIVAVDGDRHGVERRRQQVERALRDAGLPARGADEAIALCVPTWSIETWLLWLTGDGEVSEAEPYKDTPRYARGVEAGVATPRRAAEVFAAAPPREGESERVPSLADARREVERLPR